MKNNRIIVLLKSLNKREFNKFVLYVSSPFFNQSARLVKLINYLAGLYPDFPPKLTSKEILFKKLYGTNEAFEDQKIHDQLSQLLKLFEGFLAQLQLKEQPEKAELQLLDALKQRNLDKQFQRVYRRMEERLSRVENKNPDFFLSHFHMLERQAEFHDLRQIRGKHHNFSEILTSLKTFYLGSSLQYACEILNRSGIAKIDIEFNKQLIEEIRVQLEEEGNPYLEVPTISIYYKILLNLLEPEEVSHYEDLKALLSKYASAFHKSEATVMYAYAQNYCIRQVNKANAHFYEELFELYEALLDAELLNTDSGEFPHEHYKNITTLGLMLKKYDWVFDFLESYKSKLHLSVRENAHSYNLATYYYETQQFPKAMRLLQQVEFTDVYYNVSARATLLKIFYETGDYDSVRYVSQAFQAYLKRNKSIPKLHYNRHLNFIQMIKKLSRLSMKRYRLEDKEFVEEVAKLESELASLKQVSFRSWIKSKLRQHEAQLA
ncbi:MAG: hypothetical protein AAFY45_33735 [Bacteroidota bacterium]